MDYDLQNITIYTLVFVSVSLLAWVAALFIQKVLGEYEKFYVQDISETLSALFIFQDPRKLFVLNMVITVIFLLIGAALTRNFLYALLAGAFGFVIPRFLIWRAKKKRLERFANQMVDGLVVLSNALRSGQNLTQAIETLEFEMGPPISQEFGLVTREYKIGVSLEKALENMVKRVPNDDLRLMVTAINVVLGLGGNITEVFDTIAHVIRERSKIEGKTKSLTSQGKLQAVVVGLMPTFLGIIMYLMDPLSIQRMFQTLMGNIALAVMFTLQICGYLAIRKIVSIEV